MTGEHEGFHYAPLHRKPGDPEPAQRLPFDLSGLRVTGTLALCDVDKTPTENVGPSISVKITQYVRLSDESLIRLDMDRGVTSVRHGAGEHVSWKRTAHDVITEIMDLVQGDDDDNPGTHPWDELAEAARMRGIDVDGATLSGLPYQVLLTDELTVLFEF
ncbi:hypothetical protein APR04_004105 [Promicromonospora umidemergens]|uniref:Uncharacterized protein n=1 Tax=Promicromonospora umidemergens TaxID=629679 RepID=A0ABP8XSX4_9MICO|nr:hypothetical protein [Promicromonospora umidemergens]MCP2285177.1 hypothetical protein [Promicromonospora umidemergens]